jgi:peptidoglycan/LPS O-acetylase OafA/YrhL
MKRNQALDILRFIAVALVMGRHLFVCPPQTSILLHKLTFYICQVGWIGVDLFFVLSGYLISGLLFTDYLKNGNISISRFYIRRGFKIYPAFLAFLLVTSLFILYQYSMVSHLITNKLEVQKAFYNWIWPNLLFVQNYVDTQEFSCVWSVKLTWSLAIEEHFYLILPLLLVLLLRLYKSFKALPYIFICVGFYCLALRLDTTGAFTTQKNLMPSHLRIDSLLFGVVISYWKHFNLEFFQSLLRKWFLLLIFGLVCISPAIFHELSQSKYIYTFGYTQIYLGAGCILMGMLGGNFGDNFLGKILAFIGARSYSIYLWHAAGAWIAGKLINPLAGFDGWFLWLVCYIVCSLGLGIGMFYLVEAPILKFRNTFFPCSYANLK